MQYTVITRWALRSSLLYIFKKNDIDANIKCVYLKYISLIYVLEFLLLAQNLVCSLLYGSYHFIYSQRVLHINLLWLLFLYRLWGVFTFYRNKLFQATYDWDFLLSTFQVFHKMSTQSLKPLLKKYLLLSLCLLMSV